MEICVGGDLTGTGPLAISDMRQHWKKGLLPFASAAFSSPEYIFHLLLLISFSTTFHEDGNNNDITKLSLITSA